MCANIAEAWRKRRYQAAFVSELNDAEAEAAETQVWINFCMECEYVEPETAEDLREKYDFILGKLVKMIRSPQKWIL